MEKTYVYLHHQGFDFYLSNREKSDAELYCCLCDESDFLLGVYETEEALVAKLDSLFREGYDLLPCENYNTLKDKYCPPELRAWEKEWEAKREELIWDDPDSHEVCTGSPSVCSGSLPSSGT